MCIESKGNGKTKEDEEKQCYKGQHNQFHVTTTGVAGKNRWDWLKKETFKKRD